nr:hypothetical protein [Thermoflexibacter sp.]
MFLGQIQAHKELRKEYQQEIVTRLRKSRLLVLPCYFLTLLYFLYVDIAKNQFMLAAYARIFP